MRTPGAFGRTEGVPNPYGNVYVLVGTNPRYTIVKWTIKQKVIEADKWHPETHTWTAYVAGFALGNGCNLRASIEYQSGGAYWFQSGQVGGCGDPAEETEETRGLPPGSVYGARSSGTGVNCGGPCYNYSGTTTWRVIPSKSLLQMSASPSNTMAGDTGGDCGLRRAPPLWAKV